ncbi:Palmitoyltransferase Hip14 [Nowakowskiella sp. JEL0078]|nr:Palmitoyltransferase Hip14 [Nowakowskiella sp. JEL0078]
MAKDDDDDTIGLITEDDALGRNKFDPTRRNFNSVQEPTDLFDDEETLDIFNASQRGFADRVSKFLENGVDVNSCDKESCTALHWAAWNNHLTIVKTLIEHGATVDVFGGELWSTPLHWAVRAGHIHIATYLHAHSADPKLRDKQGYNAMHLAVHGGHALMVVYLLAAGMDPNCTDALGRTGVMWAVYKGTSMDCLDVLFDAGADLERLDSTGFTALHWAVVAGHLDFARALIVKGAEVDVKDPNGKTPQMWADERNYGVKFAKLLRDTGKRASSKLISKDLATNLLYILPFIMLPASLSILSSWSLVYAIPTVILSLAIIQKYLILGILVPSVSVSLVEEVELVATPFVSSIPQATLVLVGATYLGTILPSNYSLIFGLTIIC